MSLAEYEGVGLDWTRGCQGGYHGGFFERRSSWLSSILVTLLTWHCVPHFLLGVCALEAY